MTKKAVLIGIRYNDTSIELKGPLNDATNVKNILIKKYGYKKDDCLLMTDSFSEKHDL